jgi:hypothetical protein
VNVRSVVDIRFFIGKTPRTIMAKLIFLVADEVGGNILKNCLTSVALKCKVLELALLTMDTLEMLPNILSLFKFTTAVGIKTHFARFQIFIDDSRHGKAQHNCVAFELDKFCMWVAVFVPFQLVLSNVIVARQTKLSLFTFHCQRIDCFE